MTKTNRDKQLMNAALWFFALCALVIILTSCAPFDPYAALQVPTATNQGDSVVTLISPLPYWQLAAAHAWHEFTLTVRPHRAGH